MYEVKKIAHRGLSKYHTENTMEAFINAIKKNYYGIETDIHVTKDHQFIIHHDDDTGRLANKKLIIKDSTYEELHALDLIDINTNKYSDNLKIIKLEELLKLAKENEIVLVIEIKNEFTTNQIARLLELIERYKLNSKVIIISFHLKNLILIRKYNKTLNIQLLLDYYTKELVDICKILNMGLNFRRDIPNEEIMTNLIKNNIVVNVWTVNKQKDFDKLKKLKVNFITTDHL